MSARARRGAVGGLLALAACTGAPSERPPVAIGAPAPAYEAATLEGGRQALAGLRGTVVLLNVWATWCHPCREEIPYLQALHEAHAREGLSVVGVSVDAAGSEGTVRAFRDEVGMRYPTWLDPDERVQALYLAMGVPATYLIDRAGTLRWRHLGVVRPDDSTFVRTLRAALAEPPAGP